jgi:hypothetical protein
MVIAMTFSVTASAQNNDVYWLTYFANANGPNDATIYIANPGVQGAPINPATGLVSTAGYLCANVYVFDKRQEMVECCGCPLSPNAMTALSLKRNLLANPLTGTAPTGGVIKLVSSQPISVTPNGVSPVNATAVCDPGEIGTAPENIVPDLRAWATHTQQPATGAYVTTETEFSAAPLSAAEAAFLPLACQMSKYLGSGTGVCSCTDAN